MKKSSYPSKFQAHVSCIVDLRPYCTYMLFIQLYRIVSSLIETNFRPTAWYAHVRCLKSAFYPIKYFSRSGNVHTLYVLLIPSFLLYTPVHSIVYKRFYPLTQYVSRFLDLYTLFTQKVRYFCPEKITFCRSPSRTPVHTPVKVNLQMFIPLKTLFSVVPGMCTH